MGDCEELCCIGEKIRGTRRYCDLMRDSSGRAEEGQSPDLQDTYGNRWKFASLLFLSDTFPEQMIVH